MTASRSPLVFGVWLLVATNVGLLVWLVTRTELPPVPPASTGASDEVRDALARIEKRLAGVEERVAATSARPRPTLLPPSRSVPPATAMATGDAPEAAPRTTGTAPRVEKAQPPASSAPRAAATPPSPPAVRRPAPPSGTPAAWKADALQISDARRREDGLAALEAGMRSPDPATALGSLRALHDLRDVTYDKRRFRDAIVARLDDPDARVRAAAASALVTAEREPGDVERVLDVAERHPESMDTLLITVAWMSKNRVEGRLADLYVRALGVEDAERGQDVANQLRGMWVTAPVEDAVLAVWRRSTGRGLWLHILGQIQPTREPRLRAIFEILAEDRTDAPQLLARALEAQNLDEAAKPLAARLALEGLPKAQNGLTRDLLLRVLRAVGTPDEVDGLRAFASNDMVAEELRRRAGEVADAIQGGR